MPTLQSTDITGLFINIEIDHRQTPALQALHINHSGMC